MAKAFTLESYKRILKFIKNGDWYVITVEQYAMHHRPTPWAILRHDVDRRPSAAVKMATLEFSMGIYATYYFRIPFNVLAVREIQKLGHEIGYHYERKGDLRWLKHYADIVTCSPHAEAKGTPAGLFDAATIIPGNYITDTGRFKHEYNYHDHVKQDRSRNLYFNIHPERWNDGLWWYYQWLFDFLCNHLKRFVYKKRGESTNGISHVVTGL